MYPSEKKFANLLTKQNRRWQYPVRRFRLKDTTYRPDFYLPDETLYIEVIGTRQAYYANKEKIAELRKTYPNVKLIIVDIYGEPFPHLKMGYRKLLINLSDDKYKRLKELKKELGQSLNWSVNRAVENYLKITSGNRLNKK